MSKLVNVSSDTSLSILDDGALVLVDATGNPVTVQLPFATDISEIEVRKVDLGGNNVTLITKGSFDRIEDKISFTLSEYNNNVTIVSDRKSKFYVKGNNSFVSLPIQNGAARIYVSLSGSDLNDGSETSPFRTISQASRKIEEWLRVGCDIDRDVITHITNGVYDEYVDFKPPTPPKKRIIFMGDRGTMPITGTFIATGGTTTTIITEQNWTVDQWAGYWARIKTSGGTEVGLQLIHSNTPTTLKFCNDFSFVVQAEMTAEIVTPGVVVRGFRSTLPWKATNWWGVLTNTCTLGPRPQLDLSFLQIGPWNHTTYPDNLIYNAEFRGGVTLLQCVLFSGSSQVPRVSCEDGYIAIAGSFPVSGSDLAYNIPDGDYDLLYSAGVSMRYCSFFCGNYVASGGFVAINGGFYLVPGSLSMYGGAAIYGNSAILAQGVGCWIDLSCGPTTFSTKLACKNITSNYALRSKSGASCGFVGVDFSGSFTLYGFLCDQGSFLTFRDVNSSGSIPYGVACTRGSKVILGPTAGFTASVGILVDTMTGSFSDVTVGNTLEFNASVVLRDTQ